MKRFYLTTLAIMVTVLAFSQNIIPETKIGNTSYRTVVEPIKNHSNFTKDAALTQDFEENTFPPTGWDTICGAESEGNQHWYRRSGGASSINNGGAYMIIQRAATSASSDTITRPQDEWLISPVFTIPTGGVLKFNFHTNAYWMANPNNNANLNVKVSTDAGENWTNIWNEDDYYEAVEWASQQWVEANIDLSAYTGIDVKIAFQYVGRAACWFAIDNISVDGLPSLDYELSDAFVQTYPAQSVFYGLHGMYRNLPAEEVAGIFCAYEGVVSNYGTTPVDVKLTHKAYGPSDDEIFSYEYAPVTIPAAGFDENGIFVPGRDTIEYYTVDNDNRITWIEEALFIFNQYMTDYGEYRFVATLEPANGTYDNPNNRTMSYTNYTTVTDNCLYTRDNGQYVNSITASADRFTQIATTYHLYNPEDKVNAIEAYISEAEAGASFHYEILRGTLFDGFEASPIAITDSYVVGENFTPGFVTLYTEDIFEPAVTENSPDIIAVVVVMDNDKSFKVGFDETVQHNTYENLAYIDKWYYISDIEGNFMIRFYTCEQEPPQGGAVDSFTANEIEMYPNPTSGIVNFNNVENATIEVFNMMGQIVSRVENANENTTIDLSAVANGNYVVRIVKNGEVATSKLNIAR
jgi:hypothetical protein